MRDFIHNDTHDHPHMGSGVSYDVVCVEHQGPQSDCSCYPKYRVIEWATSPYYRVAVERALSLTTRAIEADDHSVQYLVVAHKANT